LTSALNAMTRVCRLTIVRVLDRDDLKRLFTLLGFDAEWMVEQLLALIDEMQQRNKEEKIALQTVNELLRMRTVETGEKLRVLGK
jgi:hypothetical protein